MKKLTPARAAAAFAGYCAWITTGHKEPASESVAVVDQAEPAAELTAIDQDLNAVLVEIEEPGTVTYLAPKAKLGRGRVIDWLEDPRA